MHDDFDSGILHRGVPNTDPNSNSNPDAYTDSDSNANA